MKGKHEKFRVSMSKKLQNEENFISDSEKSTSLFIEKMMSYRATASYLAPRRRFFLSVFGFANTRTRNTIFSILRFVCKPYLILASDVQHERFEGVICADTVFDMYEVVEEIVFRFKASCGLVDIHGNQNEPVMFAAITRILDGRKIYGNWLADHNQQFRTRYENLQKSTSTTSNSQPPNNQVASLHNHIANMNQSRTTLLIQLHGLFHFVETTSMTAQDNQMIVFCGSLLSELQRIIDYHTPN